jgi:hypothetical protein
VLLVVRNVVSAARALDLLPAFDDDPHLTLFATVVPGSRFEHDTPEFLARRELRVLSWSQARRRRWSLIIATSANGDLHRLRGPKLTLPHGVGFNKLLPDRPSAGTSGLTRRQLIHRGRLVPKRLGLAHPAELDRLSASVPRAAGRAVVVGDPLCDRVLASAGLRDEYRRALGVEAGQRLIVLGSTWQPDSLIRARPELAGALLAELPRDEYRVAAMVHANISAQAGRAEVERRLRSALRYGLRLIPPDDEWPSVLVAADLFIGDHGSTALYAAAAGVPVRFGAYSPLRIDPGSPIAALYAAAPSFEPGPPSLCQIEEAIEAGQSAAERAVVAETFARPGESLGAIRTVAYELLGLDAPTRPVVAMAAAAVRGEFQEPLAHTVLVEPADDGDGDGPGDGDRRAVGGDKGGSGGGAAFAVRRFPLADDQMIAAAVGARQAPSGPYWRHRAVDVTDPDPRHAQDAAILLRHAPGRRWSDHDDELWARQVFERFGQCTIAASVHGEDRCRAVVKGTAAGTAGAANTVSTVELMTAAGWLDPVIMPSVLLALFHREAGDLASVAQRLRGGVQVRLGTRTAVLSAVDVAVDMGAGAGPTARTDSQIHSQSDLPPMRPTVRP